MQKFSVMKSPTFNILTVITSCSFRYRKNNIKLSDDMEFWLEQLKLESEK